MKINNIRELKEDQTIYGIFIQNKNPLNCGCNITIGKFHGKVLFNENAYSSVYINSEDRYISIYFDENGNTDEPEYFMYTTEKERDLKILEILEIDIDGLM